MRIEEPFVKAHLALWLAAKGAERVTVSVDGAESNPSQIRKILIEAGFSHHRDPRSSAQWTGRYSNSRTEIVVVSKPGLDLDAMLPLGQRFVAECKGEPTEKGARSGTDLTSFYTVLGQLIMMLGTLIPAPHGKILALPSRARFNEIAQRASGNQLIRSIGISLVLIDEDGKVAEV
jgi:hypothetical protein